VPAAAGLAVLIVAALGAAAELVPAQHARPAPTAAGSLAAATRPPGPAAADPRYFAALLRPGGLSLLSPVTGKVVSPLARLGISNGMALAPDGRHLYVTSLLGRQLVIRSVATATRQEVRVAHGAQPAVSPDSRDLAYVADAPAFTTVAVRDLATGVTRSIDLSRLIGPGASMLAGQLAWTGNQVIALPQPDAVGTSYPAPVAGHRAGCGQEDSPHGLCLLVVSTGAGKLQARRVFVPWTALRLRRGEIGSIKISGLVTGQRTLLLATWFTRSPVLAAVEVGAGKVSTRAVRPLRLPSAAQVVAIAPAGDRLLYLTSETPHAMPALWITPVRKGAVTAGRRLLTDTLRLSFDGAVW
jgi:hypothetical protein